MSFKLAICYSGHARTFKHIIKNNKEKIFYVYNPDIFLHLWGDENDDETKFVLDELKPKSYLCEGPNGHDKKIVTKLVDSYKTFRQKCSVTVVDNCISMWYSINRANQLKKEYEKANGFVYDCVAKNRMDMYFLDGLGMQDIMDCKDCIYIPNHYDYLQGINDRFAFGDSGQMDIYSDLYNHFDYYGVAENVLFHPETMIKHHLDKNRVNIKRTNLRHFTIRGKNADGRLMYGEHLGNYIFFNNAMEVEPVLCPYPYNLSDKEIALNQIHQTYEINKRRKTDISEHLNTLYELGKQCERITEFGVREGISTSAFLAANPKRLDSYDIEITSKAHELHDLSVRCGIDFLLHQENTLKAEITETDLLFIDTLHTYTQVRQELMRHGNKAKKYLVFHDTELFGTADEGNASINTYQGILPAIQHFIEDNPHWKMKEHFTNNCGLTIYERQQ